MKREIVLSVLALTMMGGLQLAASAQQMTVTPSPTLGFKQIPLPSQAPSYPYPWNQPYGIPGTNPFAAVGPQVVFPSSPTPSAVPPIPASPYYRGRDHDRFRQGYWLGDDYAFVSEYPYYPVYPAYPDYPAYTQPTYAPTYNIYYPTVYQNYQASPTASSPTGSTDDSGTWYPYGYDPYSAYEAGPTGQSPEQSAPKQNETKQLIPVLLASSLKDIAQSWKTGSAQALDRHLPSGGAVQVETDGKGAQNIPSADFESMTATALVSIHTTDFRYSGVRVSADGTAVGYAVQHYKTSSGAVSPMYLSYTLAPSSDGSYVLVAMDTSQMPLAQSAG